MSGTGSVNDASMHTPASQPVVEAPKTAAVNTLTSILSGYAMEHLTVVREKSSCVESGKVQNIRTGEEVDGLVVTSQAKVVQEGDGYLKGTGKAIAGALVNSFLTAASIVEAVATNMLFGIAKTLAFFVPAGYSQTVDSYVNALADRAQLSTQMVGINASNIINTARGADAQLSARVAITNGVNKLYSSNFTTGLHITGYAEHKNFVEKREGTALMRTADIDDDTRVVTLSKEAEEAVSVMPNLVKPMASELQGNSPAVRFKPYQETNEETGKEYTKFEAVAAQPRPEVIRSGAKGILGLSEKAVGYLNRTLDENDHVEATYHMPAPAGPVTEEGVAPARTDAKTAFIFEGEEPTYAIYNQGHIVGYRRGHAAGLEQGADNRDRAVNAQRMWTRAFNAIRGGLGQ